MDAMMIVAVCGFALLSAAASWKMAVGKSRRAWLWAAIGLVLNVPGMLTVAVLPVFQPHEQRSPARASLVVPRSVPAHPVAV